MGIKIPEGMVKIEKKMMVSPHGLLPDGIVQLFNFMERLQDNQIVPSYYRPDYEPIKQEI